MHDYAMFNNFSTYHNRLWTRRRSCCCRQLNTGSWRLWRSCWASRTQSSTWTAWTAWDATCLYTRSDARRSSSSTCSSRTLALHSTRSRRRSYTPQPLAGPSLSSMFAFFHFYLGLAYWIWLWVWNRWSAISLSYNVLYTVQLYCMTQYSSLYCNTKKNIHNSKYLQYKVQGIINE